MLGVPTKASSNSSASILEQYQRPYTSKVGGRPVWLNEAMASLSASLSCRCCHRCTDIIFIVQIYAPIEDMDRALYVFACNRRLCSASAKGWIVIRDQSTSTRQSNQHHLQHQHHSNVKDVNGDKKSKWDFLSNDATNKNTTKFTSTDDEDDDMDDLYQLLNARDASLKSATNSIPAAISSTNTNATINNNNENINYDAKDDDAMPSYLASSPFGLEVPCLLLDEVEDPNDDDLCNSSDSDDDGNDAGILAAMSDSRVQQLLESYMCDEDELEVEVLNQHAEMKKKNRNHNTTTHGIDTSKVVGKVITTSDANSGTNDSSAAGGALEKRLSGKDRKSVIEAHFQKKLSYEPRQVLRYAYEGQPLWYTTPPQRLDVPPCSNCGASRVFEVQLMPTILSHITHHNTKQETTVTNAPPSTVDDLLGNELDFGVVCIFSCPNSCCYAACEEIVVVQSQE